MLHYSILVCYIIVDYLIVCDIIVYNVILDYLRLVERPPLPGRQRPLVEVPLGQREVEPGAVLRDINIYHVNNTNRCHDTILQLA